MRIHRKFTPATALEAANLIVRSFMAAVAPHYTREGVEVFLRHVHPSALLRRSAVVFTVRRAGKLLGILTLRGEQHIALFFVEPSRQRLGIGRDLVEAAAAYVRRKSPARKLLTVNASPNAVGGYRRLGFEKRGRKQTSRGITSTRMARSLLSPKA